jgi:hypothetical protein
VTDLFASEQQHGDKQAEIRAAKEAIAGPVPLISDAPSTTLVLPRGLYQRGNWQREVEVRELTGTDEEALAKTNDQLAFFSTVIAHGVIRVGEIDFSSVPVPERKFHLGELLIGEREQLFMKVVQVSFGDQKVLPFTCTQCEVEQEFTLILSQDFKPKEVEDIESMTFQFQTKHGDLLDVRSAVGADQEEALGKKGASNAEQNTILLSRCITKRNNELIPDPLGYVRALGINDRLTLLERLVKRQPSVSLDLKTNCVSCSAEQRIMLSWGDLFRP